MRFALLKFGIELEYKHKRTTNEIEGVSFRYNNIAFKGSQVDRKFSYGNLKKEFQKNIELRQEQAKQAQEQPDKQPSKVQQQAETKPKDPTIGGIELTSEQWKTLKEGGHIYLEDMNRSDGKGEFSSYIFLNDEKAKAFFSKNSPDDFIKYGKYEMRVRDKTLIEAGVVTKAKVKWFGGIDFAYPYLWKEKPTDTDYQESFSDPGVVKEKKKEQVKIQQPTIKRSGPKLG